MSFGILRFLRVVLWLAGIGQFAACAIEFWPSGSAPTSTPSSASHHDAFSFGFDILAAVGIRLIVASLVLSFIIMLVCIAVAEIASVALSAHDGVEELRARPFYEWEEERDEPAAPKRKR